MTPFQPVVCNNVGSQLNLISSSPLREMVLRTAKQSKRFSDRSAFERRPFERPYFSRTPTGITFTFPCFYSMLCLEFHIESIFFGFLFCRRKWGSRGMRLNTWRAQRPETVFDVRFSSQRQRPLKTLLVKVRLAPFSHSFPIHTTSVHQAPSSFYALYCNR